jgi:hypothetical protein
MDSWDFIFKSIPGKLVAAVFHSWKPLQELQGSLIIGQRGNAV